MAMNGVLHRLSAFTTDPAGGNPAGVWIGASLPAPDDMLAIAKDVGFSETAFLAPRQGKRRAVRYFSPEAEVAFCGHATIAAGVKLGDTEGEGEYVFETRPGDIPVTVGRENGRSLASLVSVNPRSHPAPSALLDAVLETLSWSPDDIDSRLPPAMAFAGNWHLVIAVRTRARLAALEYRFDDLKRRMHDAELTTLQLVWRESPQLFHARNPFPVGGVVEDPATGAAAAALGGYLRDARLVQAPTSALILQGADMGRPSRIHVHIPAEGGIVVSGHAVAWEP